MKAFVGVGRGLTKREVEHHVASGHAQHRTWCDASMRARGIAERHERREPGREDEDTFIAVDCDYLKLDGTEEEDDDDDEMTQHKPLSVKNWNVCGNQYSRKRSD